MRFILGGREPDITVQLSYGEVPPAADRVVEYAIPAVAFGSEEPVEIERTFVTVTVLENPLSNFPLASAFALTACHAVKAVSPVCVHALEETVVESVGILSI